jgi:DNA-binding response OmpR family regulator
VTKKNNFPSIPVGEVPFPDLHDESGGYRPAVLVVDDESNIADTLALILSRSGYSPTTAYDAESAIESALLTPPELLITDVVLPGMSGIDLAITVKRIFPECKIILFSGQAATADLLSAARQDGHHFELLHKPLHPADLLARITESFKHRRQPSGATV